MSFADILERGRQLAQNLIGAEVEPTLRGLGSLRDYLETTRELEQRLVQMRARLKELDAHGAAHVKDFHAYNTIRMNLTAAQAKALQAVRQAFADNPTVLRALPSEVVKAPPLYPRLGVSPSGALPAPAPRGGEEEEERLPGLSGLGAGPATLPAAGAAAGAALAPWMIAAIIIAALVTLGVLAYLAATTLGISAEAVRDVYVVKRNTETFDHMLTAREQFLRECQEGGQSFAECAAAAVDFAPTPAESIPELPQSGRWVPWVVGGAIALVVVGGGAYLWFAHGPGRRAFRSGTSGYERPHYRRVTAGRFPLEPAEDEGLEV